MANITTVPSGWEYAHWTGSEYVMYYGGQTIPTNPHPDDSFRNYTGQGGWANETVQFRYSTSLTIGDKTYSNVWRCYIKKPYNIAMPSTVDFLGINAIQGKEVVQVRDYSRNASDYVNVTTLRNIPDVKHIWFDRLNNLTGEITVPEHTIEFKADVTKITSLKMNEVCEILSINGNTSLVSVDKLPKSLQNVYAAFQACTNLTGTIKTDCKPSSLNNCFFGTVKPIILYGKGNLVALAKTANNKNVYVNICNRSRLVI